MDHPLVNIAYMSLRSVLYLGLQVVGVLVVEPDVGVVGVGEGVRGDPVLFVGPAPRDDPSDQGGGPQVQLQPLVF